MAWAFLFLSGIFEMLGVAMINKFHHDRTGRSIVYLIGSFLMSFMFLSVAMEELPMSTAYAIWTGIGASGGAVLGMVFYGEPKNMLRIVFISFVLGATIGLKLIS